MLVRGQQRLLRLHQFDLETRRNRKQELGNRNQKTENRKKKKEDLAMFDEEKDRETERTQRQKERGEGEGSETAFESLKKNDRIRKNLHEAFLQLLDGPKDQRGSGSENQFKFPQLLANVRMNSTQSLEDIAYALRIDPDLLEGIEKDSEIFWARDDIFLARMLEVYGIPAWFVEYSMDRPQSKTGVARCENILRYLRRWGHSGMI
jgi:hypothetical protein